MWSGSMMPTRKTKKSGSEKCVTQGVLKSPLGHMFFLNHLFLMSECIRMVPRRRPHALSERDANK